MSNNVRITVIILLAVIAIGAIVWNAFERKKEQELRQQAFIESGERIVALIDEFDWEEVFNYFRPSCNCQCGEREENNE